MNQRQTNPHVPRPQEQQDGGDDRGKGARLVHAVILNWRIVFVRG
jgi:hypothetical protein